VLAIVSTVAGLCALCARDGAISSAVNAVSNAVCLSVLPFLPLLLAAAFGKKRLRNAKRRFLPAVVNAVLCMSSISSGLIFSVSDNNEYLRGPMYFLFVLSCLWGVFVFFTGILSSLKHYRSNMKFSLVYLLAFISFGIVLQLVVPDSCGIWVCIAVALFMYYAFICELNLMFDTLTNMYNRQVYEHDLLKLSSQSYATVVFFDVDEFKTINDTYGHLFGDHCLEILSGYIWEVFSPVGSCYRIGGDEFCVLSQEMDDRLYRDLFTKLNQRVQVAIARDSRFPGVSYGCAHYNRADGGDLSDAVHEADILMYEHKRRGKRAAQEAVKEAAQ
jgi:diguanylate cyclase (GGDEF)-like protein